jgi:hypothetical protein
MKEPKGSGQGLCLFSKSRLVCLLVLLVRTCMRISDRSDPVLEQAVLSMEMQTEMSAVSQAVGRATTARH